MKIYINIFLLFICFLITQANSSSIMDEFPLVRDARNFKESKGGKAIPPQGRILESSFELLPINVNLIESSNKNLGWRYLVTLNVKRGARPIDEIVEQIVTKLLPESERNRLAISIGINEKITFDHLPDYSPTWDEIEPKWRSLEQYKVPILLQYNQWIAFRESKARPKFTASQVRKQIWERIEAEKNARNKEIILSTLIVQDESHSFPFGKMRTHLINLTFSSEFFKRLRAQSPLYIHIQDSDFTNLQTKPIFYPIGFQSEVIPFNEHYLFKRYDALIKFHQKQLNILPFIIGGAHIYDPTENLEDNILNQKKSKLWTRFASEMGNYIKHIIGQYHPYGLYFHEPNTLILDPVSIQQVSSLSSDLEKVKNRIRIHGIQFGIDSEMQEFTRNLFKDCTDQTCRDLMVFSTDTVLATSMVRGKNRYFTIQFKGEYNDHTKKFSNWSYKDIKAIHGMSQEIMHTNKWTNNISTSFKQNRVQDARKELAKLFSIFNPHYLAMAQNEKYMPIQFYSILNEYDRRVENSKNTLKEIFSHLSASYNKAQIGNIISYQLVSIAWECGQAMRLMFLSQLQSPIEQKLHALNDINNLLKRRLNYAKNNGYPAPNIYVSNLLDLNNVPYTITPLRVAQVNIPPNTQNIKAQNILVQKVKDKPNSQTDLLSIINQGFNDNSFRQLIGLLSTQHNKTMITKYAGYKGKNPTRDFDAMYNSPSLNRWNNIVSSICTPTSERE